jgi:raffinose/stachyose/melibiose transport system substrate-binding protein
LLPYFAYLLDRIGGPEVISSVVADTPDAWSDPAVAEAVTKIQDLVKAKGFVNGFSSISTDGGADIALLYSGKAAMSLGLPSNYQTIKTANPDFIAQGKLGYAPFPAVAGGKGDPKNVTGNPSNYWSISASATPEAQKIAKAYIKEQLLNSEYAADLLSVNNVPPSADIEGQLKASPEGDYYTYLYQMVQEAPNFQLSLDQELAAAQAQALLTNLQQVFLLEITPQQFVDAMNATIGQ